MDHTLKSRSRGILPASMLDELATGFRGKLIRPDNPDYETSRKVWNALIDRHPGLIAMCSCQDDVIKAVRFARVHDLDVAIRSGGHNVAGRGVCDNGMVIDLCQMNAVSVDPRSRIVDVGAGARLDDVDSATSPFDLAIPTGIAPPTGIAGLTLGGGVGWLTRKYGLTCDNLVSCDVVTAEGTAVVASKTENPDLFWALRGGGGNFGIVTRFRFQGRPVGTIFGGLILYPRSQARDVLRFYRDFIETAPDELTAYAGLMCAPDGSPIVAVGACYCGDLETGKAVLSPLQGFGTPMMDLIHPMPFVDMQKLTYQPPAVPTNNYWRSAFLDELTDAAIDVLIDHANSAQSPLTGAFIQYFGGAVGRAPDEGTAFAHRGARYNICMEAQWLDPHENDQHIAWARNLSHALEPFSQSGHMLNFLNDESGDVGKKSFGDNYERLRALKTKYDPTNFFHHNQNIPPFDDDMK